MTKVIYLLEDSKVDKPRCDRKVRKFESPTMAEKFAAELVEWCIDNEYLYLIHVQGDERALQ